LGVIRDTPPRSRPHADRTPDDLRQWLTGLKQENLVKAFAGWPVLGENAEVVKQMFG
jgi:hypothetical protein